MSIVLFGKTPAQRAIALMRRTSAVAWIPGVGVVRGLTAGNYLASDLATLASIDGLVGGVKDAMGGTIHGLQATAGSRPTLSQRVNLLTKSEQFDDAAWTKGDATIASNTAETTDPLGGNSADKITNSSVNAEHRVYQVATAAGSNRGVYAKAGTAGFLGIGWATDNAIFNLSTGVIASTTGSTTGIIQDVGGGWYRCTTTGPSSAYCILNFGETASQSVPGTAYIGTDKNIYLWGAQMELGSTATRYQRVNTASDYDHAGFPYFLDMTGTKSIGVTFPAGWESAIVIDAAKTGATVATAQNITGAYSDTTDTCGRIFIPGTVASPATLTTAETALLTSYANRLAGL